MKKTSDFQLRKNIESGIVFTLTPELLEIVEIYRGDELKRQLKKVLGIPYDLMGILENYETKDLQLWYKNRHLAIQNFTA